MIGMDQSTLAGMWKINRVLLYAFVIVGMTFCSYLFIPIGNGSWGGVLWFFSEPFLIFLAGLLVVKVIPRKIYNSVLFLLLLFMVGYCLFWLYVFTLVWYTGLPPWKVGASPWM